MLEISMEIGGLFVSSFISSTIAPGGSEAVLAYMVSEQNHNTALLIVVATVGNTLGALTTWWLGSFAANRYPIERRLTEKKQQAVQSVRKWGSWALLFSWLPVVGDGLCFAGGWLRLPLLISIVAIISGKAMRYIAIAYLVTSI